MRRRFLPYLVEPGQYDDMKLQHADHKGDRRKGLKDHLDQMKVEHNVFAEGTLHFDKADEQERRK